MVRDAATGISAFIDPYGRVTGALTLGDAGILDGRLTQPLSPPLYAIVRDRLGLFVVAATLAFLLAIRFRRSSRG